MEPLYLFLVFSHGKKKASAEPEKDDIGQMLPCIIEDFCHCPASGCLGLQQMHPLVREDSSCSFLTTPSTEPVWQRQARAAASHFKAASLTQNLPLVAQNKEEPKDICFTFLLLLLHFVQVTLMGIFEFSLQEEKNHQ